MVAWGGSRTQGRVATRKSSPSSRVEERPKPETCITSFESFDRLQRQRFERYLRWRDSVRAPTVVGAGVASGSAPTASTCTAAVGSSNAKADHSVKGGKGARKGDMTLRL